MPSIDINKKVEIKGYISDSFKEILTDEALTFISILHEKFDKNRISLLEKRLKRQEKLDSGELPKFLEETKSIRESDWTISNIPEDLQDRRVEITGPVDRKMIINALNSGAKVFMADCEDSSTPNWENVIEGQINLRDATNKTISYIDEKKNKSYKLNEQIATLLVRPRGLHLEEKNIYINGKVASGSLVDFGLYFFHNANKRIDLGTAPYFYIPKLENHKEARWWNDVFNFSQDYLKIQRGTIKVTVLIETILAAFEMDEILYELKDHIVGLNCGRWDYIFSVIKKFKNHKKFTLPDRSKVTMTVPFMKAYTELCIKTCHKRNASAIGGMAAQIPIKEDPEANRVALNKVSEDKKREAQAGHDGTWVAHPGLVPIAMAQFNKYMPNKNQIDKKREDINITEENLLEMPVGSVTKQGFRTNIDIGIQYLESWLRGIGCVPIYNLMEDAATAEISRAQLWQWVHNNVELEGGTVIDENFFKEELDIIRNRFQQKHGIEYSSRKFDKAIELLENLVLNKKFEEFLTLTAYKYV